MRLLVWLGDDADVADYPVGVNFARCPKLAGPLGRGPAPDALFVRVRYLVVLAVVVDRLLSPGHLDDLERLLVHAAVVIID